MNKINDIDKAINSYAQMCFVAKLTEKEAIDNAVNVIQEQYLQSILNS